MSTLVVELCPGSSCFARGNAKALGDLESFIRQQDRSNRVELCGHLCLGTCSHGPNIKIDGVLYSSVNPDQVVSLLHETLAARMRGRVVDNGNPTLQPLYTKLTEGRDCYKCVRACPVKSIQVEHGRATVVRDRCISSGKCVDVCPSHTKKIRTDVDLAKRLLVGRSQVIVALGSPRSSKSPNEPLSQQPMKLRRSRHDRSRSVRTTTIAVGSRVPTVSRRSEKPVRIIGINGIDKKTVRLMRTGEKRPPEADLVEVMCCEGECIAGPGILVNPKRALRLRQGTEVGKVGSRSLQEIKRA